MENVTKETTGNSWMDSAKKIFTIPHTIALIVGLTVVAVLLTHLFPAGEFNRIKDVASGKTLVDPTSYHLVKANPGQFLTIPKTLFNAMVKAADIMLFCLVVGGAFEIIMQTNTLHAATGRAAMALRGKEAWVIPAFLSIFSVGGFTIGMSVEAVGFVPIGILVARQLGFDVVTGVAMILLGCNIGFTAGLMNPFGVGIAQVISQVPLFSGMGLRAALLVVLILATSLYIWRYARRVRQDPAQSVVADVADLRTEFNESDIVVPAFEGRHLAVLIVMVAGFSTLIWGVSKKDWWIPDMAALFMVMGVLSGFVYGFGPSRVARTFVQGAKGLVFGALVVGLARAILLVMEDAKIIDTIVYNMALWVGLLPPALQLMGMYIFQLMMSAVIVSGTGMAAVTMPIMAPLSDILGVTRQTAVLIFQLADGFTNNILPMSASTMSMLGVAKIPYEKWMKFMWPLFGWYVLIGTIFIFIAYMIGY
ncbi:MAG TPA: Na+/H+ antiporter NhaC family protein [Patescibacteria group bacterium]|nr:Na+/H+ antiporter NhaC family protein [Patescibacteria group bacterium]